ncbi:MAG TPA: phosphoenolpyruvate--protein phosphotransferase [Streptosporangiaceae bacterium]|nr:phosphoenolpyruvate--protein phosphotransferase [Streptosporangiaceae bacterium]
MVGIVIVSHSARLADGVAELAREMAGPDVVIAAAGGMDLPDRPLGTDAALIMRAIEEAWSDDGVLVLMDLGSAVLSAEMAAEMLPDEQRSRVLLCEAPVVEGAVAAAVAARLGEPLERVADEARGGLAGKAAHLGAAPPASGAAAEPAADGTTGSESGQRPLELRITVANRLGLHARPAARFVQTAGQFDATVTAENLTAPAGPASARSLNGVATLGVRQGHEVLIRATGPQAEQALSALRELAERNFDESPTADGQGAAEAQPAPARPAAGSPAAGSPEAGTLPAGPPSAGPPSASPPSAGPPSAGTVLRGIPGSPGIAVGPVVHLRAAAIAVPREPATDPAEELARLDAALAAVRRQVRAARDSVAARTRGSDEADIFDAHLLFLSDEALLDPARSFITEGRNAADAWDSAVTQAAVAWQQLADPYQRERVRDLESISSAVLEQLLGVTRAQLSGPGIVVARELTPADTAGFDPAAVHGIATALGGPTSHAAILARALGIPAVLGLGDSVMTVGDGTPLLLDGEAGSVQVAPGPAELAAAGQEGERREQARQHARRRAADPAVTADGTRIDVAANAGSVQDVRNAVEAGADGIGLLRTEFLFLSAASMPTEAEQAAVYADLAEVLDGRPLIVRTLDVGADKPLPYLPRPEEPNPQLGQRGIRLGLARPEILRTQVRAVLRVAARYPLRLMFPMVATVSEVRAARDLVADARRTLAAEGAAVPADEGMQVGIMIEVPAAALTAPVLAPEVDFFSVGTNDLTQYTMAADREVAAVAGLSDGLQPAVLTLIGRAAAASGQAGRWTGVCGELAADPLAVPLLIGLGVRELSVNAAAVATVKEAVRSTDLTAAAELAAHALSLPSAEAVRDLVRNR